PNNMVLSIVGDFNVDEMQAAVENIFGAWQKGAEYTVSYPERADIVKGNVDVAMVRDQVILLMGRPSPINFYHEDFIPARLLNYVMFNSLGSRLFILREQSGLFYTAFGQLAAGSGPEKGYDFVGALLSPENVVKSEAMIKDLLQKASQGDITERELDGAKRLYLKTLLDLVATNGSVASMFGVLHSWELGFDFYDKALARTQELSIEEINRIAQRYCSPENMIRVRVGRMPTK
ncbi:insulinase family protein, partial [Candidatus Dependentiae bacterium]|nr:insulinase family protein [Candidatus Dependentiae bacterium]